MRRESDDGHVCGVCLETVYLSQCACPEPNEELSQDLFQQLLAVSYERYMLRSTSNLVGHIQHSSPLIVKRRLQGDWLEHHLHANPSSNCHLCNGRQL